MATLKQIAEDRRKALADLEKELGMQPGGLVREVEHFTEELRDWKEHLPYGLAAVRGALAVAQGQ